VVDSGTQRRVGNILNGIMRRHPLPCEDSGKFIIREPLHNWRSRMGPGSCSGSEWLHTRVAGAGSGERNPLDGRVGNDSAVQRHWPGVKATTQSILSKPGAPRGRRSKGTLSSSRSNFRATRIRARADGRMHCKSMSFATAMSNSTTRARA